MIKRSFEFCGITSSNKVRNDASLKDIMKKIDINDDVEDDDDDPEILIRFRLKQLGQFSTMILYLHG